jgi:predicted DNA-binding transcriptional regulator AlpA
MKIATKNQQIQSPGNKHSRADTSNAHDDEREVTTIASKAKDIEDHPSAKKQSQEQRKLAAFARELAIIKAQCDAGMEPAISIAATCYMSKRSHATVYRDIQKRILPSPMKIGRNSALPYSVVKAYAAGQLVGGAE